ncbi:MAG: hypothetical protein HY288_19990 [Planctomycetia bacterium]|nr:hypothetical protein [Planctomycetia bacterium]
MDGGVFGVREWLLVVPISELQFNHGRYEICFVVDMPKEEINAAPGFDKQDSPDFANPNGKQHIDDRDRRGETTATGRRDVIPR